MTHHTLANITPTQRRHVGDVVDISKQRRARIASVGRVGYMVEVIAGRGVGDHIFRHEFEVFDPDCDA